MHRFFILEVFLLVKLVSRVGATVFTTPFSLPGVSADISGRTSSRPAQ